jgi:cystathionine beta-lyase/cystathionine gamma-synthase
MRPDDICPQPEFLGNQPTQPLAPAIYPAAVYRCESTEDARRMLAGELAGYVYSRDGHPNGDQLAEKCRQLHGAERAIVCGSGMAALSAAVLSQVSAGEHVVASQFLYGRTLGLLAHELPRFGVASTVVDTCDLAAVAAACQDKTRLIVVETISNPLLRVADLASLAALARQRGARLLVDNTFAGPTVCRPLELGAELVMESLTKIMNGHSDVLLGLVCGTAEACRKTPDVVKTWGFSANPFDCWLAHRGLGTLALRAERANQNALAAAHFLAQRPEAVAVHYPGLTAHPDHALAARQFARPAGPQYGSMVTFTLAGGTAAADRFIAGAKRIPFCPSLGDLGTTLSHPESTSHRTLSPADRERLGVYGGTIRLSVGIESPEAVVAALEEGLNALG